MIEFSKVKKCYTESCVLEDVSFRVNDGEFFVIVGLSGSGKTTLLKMMNHLISPDSGDVLVDRKNIKEWNLRELRLETGYVLQEGSLFPNLTIRENISLIPKMKKWKKVDINKKMMELMPIVGLDPETFLDKYPDQLSGGERQRVGILRAIIGEPKIILMDEPFSALDPLIRRDLQSMMKDLHKRLGVTVVFVTHDMREALLLADRIAIVNSGRLEQVDTPENIVNHPKTDFVRDMFESEELI